MASPSFSSTTFENFPGISDLLPEIFKFQQQTKLLETDKNNLSRRQTLGTLFVGQQMQKQQTHVKYVFAYFYYTHS